jgi:hypothetical protein
MLLGTISAIAAAGFWLMSSTIDVSDNVDTWAANWSLELRCSLRVCNRFSVRGLDFL